MAFNPRLVGDIDGDGVVMRSDLDKIASFDGTNDSMPWSLSPNGKYNRDCDVDGDTTQMGFYASHIFLYIFTIGLLRSVFPKS